MMTQTESDFAREHLINSDLAYAAQVTVNSAWTQGMTRAPSTPRRLSYPTAPLTLEIPKRMLELLRSRADEQNITIPELLRRAVVTHEHLTTDDLPPQRRPTPTEARSARLNARCGCDA